MLFATAAWALSQSEAAPNEKARAKFEGEYAKAVKILVAEHLRLAEYLEVTKMFRLARVEFERALMLDPGNATARKKMGYKKEGEEWVHDPAAKVALDNQRKEEDAKKVAAEYQARSDKIKERAVKLFGELAQSFKKSGIPNEVETCSKRLLGYDGANKTAREALGSVLEKNRWVSKSERAVRAEFQGGVAGQPAGQMSNERTEIEEKVRFATAKRISDKFLIETTHFSPKQMGKAAQLGAQAWEIYHKLFGVGSPLVQERLHMLLLKSRAEHTEFIRAFDSSPPAIHDFILKMGGTMCHRPPLAECIQPEPDLELVSYDFVIHATVHLLQSRHLSSSRAWFQEGLAYYLTTTIAGTAAFTCVSLAGTSEEGGKDYADPANWPSILREVVAAGKDPDFRRIFASDVNGLDRTMLIKAWSLVDFLVQEHRSKLPEFARALQEDPKDRGAGAFEKVFRWTPDDLELVWKEFVRRTY